MSVATSIAYVTRPQTGHQLSALPSGLDGATRRAAVVPEPRPVQISDTRAFEQKPSLSRSGFELIQLKGLPSLSWTTPEQVSPRHYAAIQSAFAQVCTVSGFSLSWLFLRLSKVDAAHLSQEPRFIAGHTVGITIAVLAHRGT